MSNNITNFDDNFYIDIKKIIKSNKVFFFVFIYLIILTFIFFILYFNFRAEDKNYISESKFEVINGDKTLNLYQGTYHRITTYDDVATIIRSNQVLELVIFENNLNVELPIVRSSIDLYEVSNMKFILKVTWPDSNQANKINLSLIKNYLKVIEDRMDNDNKSLFDVKILESPFSYYAGNRIYNKLLSAFLFSIFISTIIVLLLKFITIFFNHSKIKKYKKQC